MVEVQNVISRINDYDINLEFTPVRTRWHERAGVTAKHVTCLPFPLNISKPYFCWKSFYIKEVIKE